MGVMGKHIKILPVFFVSKLCETRTTLMALNIWIQPVFTVFTNQKLWHFEDFQNIDFCGRKCIFEPIRILSFLYLFFFESQFNLVAFSLSKSIFRVTFIIQIFTLSFGWCNFDNSIWMLFRGLQISIPQD